MPCLRRDTRKTGEAVQEWYATAAPGDALVVAMPGYACQQVRLLHQERQRVHWWPRGEKGMTMALAEAVTRLQMLRGHMHDKGTAGMREAHASQ